MFFFSSSKVYLIFVLKHPAPPSLKVQFIILKSIRLPFHAPNYALSKALRYKHYFCAFFIGKLPKLTLFTQLWTKDY